RKARPAKGPSGATRQRAGWAIRNAELWQSSWGLPLFTTAFTSIQTRISPEWVARAPPKISLVGGGPIQHVPRPATAAPRPTGRSNPPQRPNAGPPRHESARARWPRLGDKIRPHPAAQ